ncbi:SKN1-domain-containing protein [Ceraceosorus guamensis]|uniref:SKN1-domain-containing protein n=1 Tax=Ceraceosorus guamensis TaxID=1522189 RepID=A0A316WD51_9BASI|nr:SKN1-domain-containing protein [Ceraceosorus guamensis]PWN45783.1 SKN1-domain-containing protein [Ceraceosorus guamensis]
MGLLLLFAGYPIIAYVTGDHESTKGAFNLGGTNSSGQVSSLASDFPGWKTGSTGLIDPDTPKDAYTRKGLDGVTDFDLVFSDEFEVEGRSFYPGDDPFWEAVDLHYWATNNYEWYDPAAVTTRNGALEITLDQYVEHNLNFRGGMLQSWNKFCFTGGFVVASVRLPGTADVAGLWPAMWTMGNLGRAGYGSTLEGTWPYSYDACDVGTLQNQTTFDGQPEMAVTGGDVLFNRKHNSNALSFLTGQKLSACTCPDDDHPGPKNKDGSWVGRSAPEIDVFEAQSTGRKMTLSQSAQIAPFNYKYKPYNTTEPAYTIYDPLRTIENTYTGELMQQAMSAVTDANQAAMQRGGDGGFSEYGFEYQPGHGGYIEWVSDGKPAWRVNPAAMSADPRVGIAERPIPNEPMYIIFNVGVSKNFGAVDWDNLQWPATMAVEWVRVYQPKGQINVGCSPESMPTADYINRHLEAYNNPNLTLWGNTPEEGGYGANWPRNRLNPNGCNAQASIFPGSPTNPKPKAPHLREDQIAEGESF